VFDAFERLHDLAIRENALTQDEFSQAFVELGVKESEALETFMIMDSKGKELVSLPALRIALVGTSKQAVLWELRCRLMTQGVTPNDFSKVKKILEIARRPRHRTVRQRRRQPLGHAWAGQFRAAAAAGEMPDAGVEDYDSEWETKGGGSHIGNGNSDTSTGFIPSSSRLSRIDWGQMCAAIGLTMVEADWLFTILADGKTGMVDLKEMFTVLRADVAPHVSLERFATRVMTRYGSLQNAFAATSTDGRSNEHVTGTVSRMMHWPEFHSMAVALDVKDSNAERLWSTLMEAQQNLQHDGDVSHGTDEGLAAEANTTASIDDEGVTETVFVKQLTMWAPGTALCALRNQVDEHFSDVGELRHALGQTGSALSAPISPAELDVALLTVGIPGCNVEGVCNAVQSAKRGGRKGGSITLDDVVEALRNTWQHSTAQGAVRDDLRPFWQKMHNMQADLQNSKDEPLADFGTVEGFGDQKLQTMDAQCQQQTIPKLSSSASLPTLRGSNLRSRATRQSQNRRSSIAQSRGNSLCCR
jgi:hypothetical protein